MEDKDKSFSVKTFRKLQLGPKLLLVSLSITSTKNIRKKKKPKKKTLKKKRSYTA